MTRKHHSESSQSASSSPATVPKPRRRITPPTKKIFGEEDDDYNDDYADASESQGDEYEHSEKEVEEEEDDDEDDTVSKSMSIEQSHSYIPETKSPSISPSGFREPMLNASSSYVKIASLPIFRGTPTESPITHLSRFNKVCRANNASSIDTQKRIFPVTLEEEAELWYDLNIEPYYPHLSWDEIKLSFLQAYYKFEPVEELRSELMGIHQGEKESVRSYFLRLQWVLKRWPEHELHENVIKGVFVDGLRQEFHDWVLMQKPVSLNDALKLAFGFEQMRGVRGTNKGKVESDEGEKVGVVESMKKNQCQCTKHQCGNKNLLRNNSLRS